MRSKDSKKIIKVKIALSYVDGLLVGPLTGSVNRTAVSVRKINRCQLSFKILGENIHVFMYSMIPSN